MDCLLLQRQIEERDKKRQADRRRNRVTEVFAFLGFLAVMIAVIWLITLVTTDCHEEATQAEVDACYDANQGAGQYGR